LIFAALLLSSQLALAQFTQQGPKLIGLEQVVPRESAAHPSEQAMLRRNSFLRRPVRPVCGMETDGGVGRPKA
jgi:hypothetical protein